jgi:hypothetical protein
MDVLERRITHIGELRELVFAAVQLAPPQIHPVTATRTYDWHPSARFERCGEAERILTRLFAKDAGRSPDVVVFSEYSLPPEAHEQIPFQELANTNNCIIIAGSYFDTDKNSDHFRHNVCKIYLPSQDPVFIFKHVPADDEKDYLVSPEQTNIARLLWEPPGKDAVGINVFLCRDYLSPFHVQDSTRPDRDARERVSLLDWEREGINIVVMYNKDPAMFEAAAAFDIRRTHGKRKLVLLVNSSNSEQMLATALIGPTAGPEKSRSVVASMPPEASGVLMVETRLCDVVARKEYPDTDRNLPVKHWDCYRLVPDPYHLEPLRRKQDIVVPQRRGILHPAFLAFMQKYIVIELFVGRSTQKIREAFQDRRGIDFVTASYVRGVEDVLIRRYVESHTLLELNAYEIPSLSDSQSSLPYSRLTKDEFAEAFDFDQDAPHLRMLIDPRDIRKFRGEKMTRLRDEKWADQLKKISDTIRPALDIKEIIALANEMRAEQKIPDRFRHAFCGVENVVPVGREFNRHMRETYLFVAIEASEEARKRFGKFLDDELMADTRVRDIYYSTRVSEQPQTPRSKFSFLLRLKCMAFETDDIVASIQEWASEAGVHVGTRSYDAWRNLRRAATMGMLESTMSQEERDLQKALFALDREANFPAKEIQVCFAEAIKKYTRQIRAAPADNWNSLLTDLRSFLHYVCLYNCTLDPEKQEHYRESAATRWNSLFKYLETASSALLIRALDLPLRPNRRTMLKALQKKCSSHFEDGDNTDDGYLKWFADLYGQLAPPTQLLKEVNTNLGLVSSFRNLAVHGGSAEDLGHSITVTAEGWATQFPEIERKVAVMCSLIGYFAEAVSASQKAGASS